MKKLIALMILMAATVLIAYTLLPFETAHAYVSGAPAGHTGSPGDGLDCTQCHSGAGNAQPLSGTITSDIPASGYVGGNTYTFTVLLDAPGHTKFGFEAAVQDVSGSAMGTLVNTSTENQMISGNTYVTHTAAGTTGSNPKSWTFDWTAPLGSDSATVYVSYNAANGNFLPSGDSIYTDNKTYYVDPSSIDENNSDDALHIFPNPASDWVHLVLPRASDPDKLHLFDLSGNEMDIAAITSAGTSGSGHYTLDLSGVPTGLYFLIGNGNGSHTLKCRILVSH